MVEKSNETTVIVIKQFSLLSILRMESGNKDCKVETKERTNVLTQLFDLLVKIKTWN